MAKYMDINSLIYLWSKITNLFVKKESGKGLSTNDLTDDLVIKIQNAGDSSFSGNYNDLTNKPVIPDKTSQLTNDSNYQTAAQVTSTVTAAVAGAGHLKRLIVASLPAVGTADVNTIYMVLVPGATGSNKYTEWMVINGEWEQTGDTAVDLSGYVKTSDITTISNAEIDTITAS